MSKKINKQNTKKSLQQLRAKRKQYAEGGVPEEEKRIDTIATKQAKAQEQYQADRRKVQTDSDNMVRPAVMPVKATTGYKNSGIVAENFRDKYRQQQGQPITELSVDPTKNKSAPVKKKLTKKLTEDEQRKLNRETRKPITASDFEHLKGSTLEQKKEIAAWQESAQQAMESDEYYALLKRNEDSKGQDKEALAELKRINKKFEDSRPNFNLDSLDKEPRRETYRTSQKEPGSRETPSDEMLKTGNDDAGGMAIDTVVNEFWWQDHGYESLPEALADGWVFNKETGTFQQTGNTGNGGNGGDGGTDDEFTGGRNVKQIGTGAPLELAQRNPEYTTVEMEAESMLKAVPEAEQRADEYVAQYPEWDETQKAEAREWAVKAFKDNTKNPEMPDWLMDSDFLKGLEAANNLEIDTTKTAATKGTVTKASDIQKLDDAEKITKDEVTSTQMDVTKQDDIIKVKTPKTVEGGSYAPTLLGGKGADVEAARLDDLRPEALAELDDATLSERAFAAQRDPAQEKAALQEDARKLRAQRDAYVPSVTGDLAKVSPTKGAEESDRKLILGQNVDVGRAAKIIDAAGFDAASRRTVKGTAAKNTAAKMIEVVGELPPNITAAIVEDPATVTAQIDSEPVEVQAAVAALPTEALVSSQMESLLGGMEDGEIPMWARPAVQQVNDMMTRRGLTASSVGRDALFNSIIQSAMPMAQSNAQALQARAAQNLSNEQQANITQSTQSMQMRLANLANQQTSESQTAQMSQQMKTLQSQFTQDSVMTSAQFQQQTRTQNLANRQEKAKTDAQNDAAMRAQNLGNEQQIELAEMQYMNATESENMSAEQQSRMMEFQTAADFMAKNEGFVQQMELANLSNRQQMELANLTSKNQQQSELMSNDEKIQLANLNNRMQTNLTQAKIAESLNLAQLSVDQQRAVQNASMVANIDLTQFNADQQVQIANSKFMQTMTITDFNAEQQAAMQNATALASLDLANLDKNTKLAAQNAQAFLQLDMTNLSNEQQANMLRSQNNQQAMLSDQAAQNAASQFAAASQQQADQFMASLNVQVEQYNSSAAAAQSQFNASEANRMEAIQAGNDLQAQQFNEQMSVDVKKFNEQSDFQRDQWNAANAQAVEQSNTQWRRQANLQDTAAQNAANQQNAQIAYNMSAQEQTQLWQQLRDEAAYVRQNFENEQQRKAQMIATAIGNEAVFKDAKNTSSFINTLEAVLGSVG
jgi:hypothetical protein